MPTDDPDSSNMTKTSVIFCAGAWHSTSHIDPLLPFFKNAGYRVVPHISPSSSAQSHLFEDDIKAIQSLTTAELQSGHDVVLILHSWAGLSGLEAVNKLTATSEHQAGNLLHIILLASFLDPVPIAEHLGRNDFVRPDLEKGISWTQHGEKAFYNDIPLEKAQPFIEALTSLAFYTDPPQLPSDRWKATAPVTYFLCNQDNAVPPEIGEKTAADYGMQLVRMDAGHCPFATQPENFVEVVNGRLRT